MADVTAALLAQQGFPSLPGGDNHQKILGQGSGIKLTPSWDAWVA